MLLLECEWHCGGHFSILLNALLKFDKTKRMCSCLTELSLKVCMMFVWKKFNSQRLTKIGTKHYKVICLGNNQITVLSRKYVDFFLSIMKFFDIPAVKIKNHCGVSLCVQCVDHGHSIYNLHHKAFTILWKS